MFESLKKKFASWFGKKTEQPEEKVKEDKTEEKIEKASKKEVIEKIQLKTELFLQLIRMFRLKKLKKE